MQIIFYFLSSMGHRIMASTIVNVTVNGSVRKVGGCVKGGGRCVREVGGVQGGCACDIVMGITRYLKCVLFQAEI